jgi:hypothetical protein
MIREIKSCRNCPFSGPDPSSYYMEKICWEIERQEIEWKDKDSFSDMYHEDRIPSICPLKKEPIIIKLHEKLDV